MNDEYGFVDAVATHFASLCDDYGFQQSAEYKGALTIVRLVSPKVVVELLHGTHRGGEIEAYISKADSDTHYPIEHLVGRGSFWGLANTPDEVQIQTKKIAEFLARHGRKALLGEEEEFKKLANKSTIGLELPNWRNGPNIIQWLKMLIWKK